MGLWAAWTLGCAEQYHTMTRTEWQALEETSAPAVFDLYWNRQMSRHPERATYLGDHRFDDRLYDYGDEARHRDEFVRKLLLEWSHAFREKYTPRDPLNHDLFEAMLQEQIDLAKYPEHLMPVRQQNSPQISLGMLQTYHPFDTPHDCENYARRLRGFSKQVDDLIALMREGIRRNVVRPRIIIEQALPQLEAMITDDPRDCTLYQPARSLTEATGGDAMRDRIADATTDAITALRRLHTFLKETYLPACPEEIHQIGLDELDRIHAEMREIARSVGFNGTVQQFIETMRNDPAQHNTSAEEMMRRHREILTRSDANLHKLFGRLPETPYDLKRIEAFRAPGAPAAYYYNAPEDGSRPAYFYVNVYKPETRPIYTMEALAYHEAMPGHHLQIALVQERDDLPAFRRFENITAFVEGWGLYSELLGYDLGGYQDPYARFGQLTYDTWRSARLVVDTGMHYFGWTRQRAIDFMKENTGLSEQNIISEVDRYIAWPGQALAYKIGQLEILRLRDEAKQRLGDKFDVRAFHDHLLAEGSLPLDMLRKRMLAWMESQAD